MMESFICDIFTSVYDNNNRSESLRAAETTNTFLFLPIWHFTFFFYLKDIKYRVVASTHLLHLILSGPTGQDPPNTKHLNQVGRTTRQLGRTSSSDSLSDLSS